MGRNFGCRGWELFVSELTHKPQVIRASPPGEKEQAYSGSYGTNLNDVLGNDKEDETVKGVHLATNEVAVDLGAAANVRKYATEKDCFGWTSSRPGPRSGTPEGWSKGMKDIEDEHLEEWRRMEVSEREGMPTGQSATPHQRSSCHLLSSNLFDVLKTSPPPPLRSQPIASQSPTSCLEQQKLDRVATARAPGSSHGVGRNRRERLVLANLGDVDLQASTGNVVALCRDELLNHGIGRCTL
ncbi:hypothetical protein BDK51DRAFT_46899 [Blyttiomyces helicus]|uniref:Uncharacterized protein n=1 Tax=Blyttiomyces helicus TaxID=388810 RepID=A0A4P9VY92_9FUNG|nr:hypothetical protein BDK51DRAFT_46899 [Blyttiomyces helicus]|eukprot:RKO84232.1 hypothetical protein BDK51DRAFT_46899 [Blyttiomyces helicus]